MIKPPLSGDVDTSACPVPTIIEFLLDETGSMSQIAAATVGGYNDFLDEQRQTAGLCLVSLTKFDRYGLHTPYVDIDAHMVPALTLDTFLPYGGTNLHDAILSRLGHLEQRLKQWDVQPRVLFVVMTDGMDNASRHKAHEVAEAIRRASAAGQTCVYLGAHDRAVSVAASLGFQPGHIRSFESARMRETLQELGRAATAFRAGSTGDFFAVSV